MIGALYYPQLRGVKSFTHRKRRIPLNATKLHHSYEKSK